MALIWEGMTCAICEQPLDIRGPMIATSHFIGDESDPLWRFSDAAMHYECFQKWEHRDAFVKKYNETMGQKVWGNGTRHQMNTEGSVISVKATRDIDTIIAAATAKHPRLRVEQMKVKHPGADDDGLWFFHHPESPFEVQLESSFGNLPFLVETNRHNKRGQASTVTVALELIESWLGLSTGG